MRTTLIALAFAAAALPATAQTVYRCGSEYSREPCPDAKVVPTVNSASSEREQQKAREATLRDAKAADAMEKARIKEEAKPVSAYIPPGKAQEQTADAKPDIDKPKKSHYFTAVAPGSKDKKKKAASKKKRHTA